MFIHVYFLKLVIAYLRQKKKIQGLTKAFSFLNESSGTQLNHLFTTEIANANFQSCHGLQNSCETVGKPCVSFYSKLSEVENRFNNLPFTVI